MSTENRIQARTKLILRGLDLAVEIKQTMKTLSILFYVKKGNVQIQNENIMQHSLIHFNDKGNTIIFDASEGTEILFHIALVHDDVIIQMDQFLLNCWLAKVVSSAIHLH